MQTSDPVARITANVLRVAKLPACPWCAAKAGEPCISDRGRIREYPHKARSTDNPLAKALCKLAAVEAELNRYKATSDELTAALRQERDAPLPMLLFCPNCDKQHVDVGEYKSRPHKTHLCNNEDGRGPGCGHLWRPSLRPTVGVTSLSGVPNLIPKRARALARLPIPTPPEEGAKWQLSDFDGCECGDYRCQHEGGKGRCKMPNDLVHGFKPCERFRLFDRAKAMPDWIHWTVTP